MQDKDKFRMLENEAGKTRGVEWRGLKWDEERG